MAVVAAMAREQRRPPRPVERRLHEDGADGGTNGRDPTGREVDVAEQEEPDLGQYPKG